MNNNLDLVLNRRDGVDHDLLRQLILRDIFRIPEEAPRVPFNFEELDPEFVKTHFRFSKEDIPRLVEALGIPIRISTRSSLTATGIEGICILLRRLSYPNRLCDLEHFFMRSPAALSEIANFVNLFISETHGHLLENLNSLHWLNQDKMIQYANAIVAKGAAVPNCWAFIDGTARPICRPSIDQEAYYSGHKRFHCVKYQALVTPDGLTVSLMGAFEGRRHDAGIFRESGLYEQLEEKAQFQDGSQYVIFGDQAYGIRELSLCPFPGRGLNEEQAHFNASMTPIREAVEWSFSKIVAEFAFIDFKKNQKLLLQDIESMYKSATILTNCHTCLYGNQTATYFNIDPVPLEEYLNV